MEFATIMTVSTFLFIAFGLGYAALLLRKPTSWVDTALLSIAVGVAIIPLAVLLLRILHIPLDIRVFIFLAAIGPAIGIMTSRVPTKTTITRYAALGVVVIAAILITTMMYVGATKYPYLENDDPWGHATGAHYVALEKTTAQELPIVHYLEPYPPYYTALMGMLHQTNDDLQWVLKFFNALLIGISIIAVFYAFEAFSGDAIRAAAGAVIIGMLPAYMSHFIWSQTLAIPVFLIAIWAVLSIEPVQQWYKGESFWFAALLVWSATIIQPSTAAVFALLFVTLGLIRLGISYLDKKADVTVVAAIIVGGVLSFFTWLGFIIVYGWTAVQKQIGIDPVNLGANDTSGGIIYSLKDIIFAPMSSKIDQATGLGWFVSLLVLAGIILFLIQWRKLRYMRNSGKLIMLVWLIIGIIGIQGNALPFKLFPHRFWVFLAIPVAFIAAEAIAIIAKSARNESVRIGIIVVLTAVVVLTSFGPRIAVQQAIWPPGVGWTGNEELSAYIQLKQTLPQQTKIFALCTGDDHLIGMNMHAEPWEPSMIAIKGRAINITADEVISFMLTNQYQYMIFDYNCVQKLGPNRTQELGDSFSATNMFEVVLQQPGIIVMKLRS